MRRSLLPALLLAASISVIGGRAPAAPCCTEGYADLLESVLPAVVSLSVIKITGTKPADGQVAAKRERFFGSGFIIDPSGTIVTNRHVIQGAVEITAVFGDGTQRRARLIGAANIADLAVLKVDADQPLPALKFADSSGARIGDPVLAIGNPYGLGLSVSAGIISGLNRNLNQTPFDDDIQTDAAINPGNSGGPLVTLSGEVIGVDTALYTQTGGGYIGIGYAIPANDADFIVRHLLDPTLPQPGWIGVSVQDVSPELAKGFGVPRPGGAVITAIDANGPGRTAGLRDGDVILAVSGQPISDTRALIRQIAVMDIGSTVDLTVWRDRKQQAVQVSPIEWPNMSSPVEAAMAPAAMMAMASVPDTTLKVAAITDAARQKLGIPAGVSGVVVEGVARETDPGEKGIQLGDVIVNAGGVPVSTPDDLDTLIGKARSARQAYLPLLVSGKDGLHWVSYFTGVKSHS